MFTGILGETLRLTAKLEMDSWLSGVDLSTDTRLGHSSGCRWFDGRLIGEMRGDIAGLSKLPRTKVFLIA